MSDQPLLLLPNAEAYELPALSGTIQIPILNYALPCSIRPLEQCLPSFIVNDMQTKVPETAGVQLVE